MTTDSPGIDYERLCAYRFRDTDQASRTAVWKPIASLIHRAMGEPQRVLVPAAGRGGFITAVPAGERWAVDQVAPVESSRAEGFRMMIGDVMEVELPADHFDGVFVSNLLEQLPTQEAIGSFLARMLEATRASGRVAVMGPNYRLTAAYLRRPPAWRLFAKQFLVIGEKPGAAQ